jgi:hypothetical protein
MMARMVIDGGIVISPWGFYCIDKARYAEDTDQHWLYALRSAYGEANICWYRRFFRGGSWKWRFRLENES